MNPRIVLAALACLLPLLARSEPVSLAGSWRFELDRADAGIAGRWFERSLPGTVSLPGTLSAQGIGDAVTLDTKWTGGIVDKSWFTEPEYEAYRKPGNVKVPFWLQPEKSYAGAAWYQRDIEVPAAWEGATLELLLERPHWETRVWMDGEAYEPQNALGTPHKHQIRPLSPGKHVLTIRVDNRMVVDVGENSHSVSDHTQGNWNGIAGRIELRALSRTWIAKQRIDSKNDGMVRIGVSVRSTAAEPAAGSVESVIRELRTGAVAGKGRMDFNCLREAALEVAFKLDKAPRLWSEFAPELYEAETRIVGPDGKVEDVAKDAFGFRELTTDGNQFLLNGQKLFVRGTLDCCTYPRTGHPPVEVAEWKRIIGVVKGHGLNLIRFHSWCPPEAAFTAADELGCYFHVEASSWANQSTTVGDGKPVDQWLYQETDRILDAYGNHPCFLLMPYGNEPAGKNHKVWLAEYVNHFKARDSRRLWTSGAGWPELPENQWNCDPHPRVQAWGGGLKSRINAQAPETCTDYRQYIAARKVPVVSHEIGQWCAYPNFEEIPKYSGYLKPRNFEIFRDRLNEHHLLGQARDFLMASGKLQTLCYKEDIESALRTPRMGGFELLDLHDFPGQGTALVGVLDPFWEGKGYVTSAEYSRFCNATVPLARLPKRVFTTAEKLEATLEVAHFGPAALENAVMEWKFVDVSGKLLANGYLPSKTISVGNGLPLGSISLGLSSVPAPARCKLVVGIAGTGFENDWDLWVYPAKQDDGFPQDVTIASSLDQEAMAALQRGGKVLLMIAPERVKKAEKNPVILGFSSIFWNTAWTKRQPPTTLGILCDPKHPALASFPTESHSNWQWWYLVTRAGAMILDDLPAELRPVVQVIDDWFTARKLGLVFEAKAGGGKLLVCSVDLEHGLDQNPVACQLRQSLLRYLGSDRFDPKTTVTPEAVAKLFAP